MMETEAALPKVLCVDDEDSILQSLERLLKSRFRVLTSTSPHEALTLLAEHKDCAVVLSDYRMPGMNGVDFLRHVRRMMPQCSRAVLSGQIDLAQVSDALNASDIHKFFLKPWENDYLLLQMIEAVQTHRTLLEKAHFEYLSITDPITQLTNHRFFQDEIRRQLEIARAAGQKVAMVMFDVDHFKTFNDRFGHPEGDRLLFGVASTLKNQAGENGVVSRYGGEEFTLILPNTQPDLALALCEKIRAHFEHTPFTGLSSGQAYITVSGGLACFPEHATEAGELIAAADRALYQAKRQGRNQVVQLSKK